jgi:cyanophycinase
VVVILKTKENEIMKKIHYYFGWFNSTIPKQVAQALHNDIPEKKSLVMITTTPSDDKSTDEMAALTKDTWFEPASVVFDNYHSIDYRIKKEEAHELLKNASAIFLHGGYPDKLKYFLEEYELLEAIEESNAAVVMGASAGGMNMSAKFVYGKYIDSNRREPGKIYDGLGLDNFALQSHAPLYDIETLAQNEYAKNHLIPLSESIDVYVACEESTIRIKNGKFEVMGDVYLISKSEIQKVKESTFVI